MVHEWNTVKKKKEGNFFHVLTHEEQFRAFHKSNFRSDSGDSKRGAELLSVPRFILFEKDDVLLVVYVFVILGPGNWVG